MNKFRNFKIYMLIIDFIVITTIVFLLINQYNQSKESTTEYLQGADFKKFTILYPLDYEYNEVDDDTFSLKNNKYKANVKIFVMNGETTLGAYMDEYYEYLVANGASVVGPDYKTDGEITMYIFNKEENGVKSTLCYFQVITPYVYEVEIFNNDNSFDATSVDDIYSILYDTKYNEDDVKLYRYDTEYAVFNIADDEV